MTLLDFWIQFIAAIQAIVAGVVEQLRLILGF